MKLLSIDIETLGLDVTQAPIIEFGMSVVYDNNIVETYSSNVRPINDNWWNHADPTSIVMNANIIQEIYEGKYLGPTEMEDNVFWIINNYWKIDEKVVVLGKNAANFDIPILKNNGFEFPNRFHRRVVDLGSIWINPDIDEEPPNLQKCLERAGIQHDINHRAGDDAYYTALAFLEKF